MTETIRIGAEPEFEQPDVDLYAPPSPEETGPRVSPLDALRAKLAAPVERKPCVLRVPSRPGVTLRFRPDIDGDKRKAWEKRATKKSRRPGRPDEVDEMMFAMLVLANTHEATLVDGREAYDEEGTPLTFAHAQLWDMVGGRDPQSCIRLLFANDAHVLLASGEVLLASGFDDDLDESDPTKG